MQITDVRLNLVEGAGRLKAVSSVTVDNEFVIHDIKVIEGEANTFIAFPSRKNKDGEYADICHPVNQDTRNKFQDAILEAYKDALENKENEAESSNE